VAYRGTKGGGGGHGRRKSKKEDRKKASRKSEEEDEFSGEDEEEEEEEEEADEPPLRRGRPAADSAPRRPTGVREVPKWSLAADYREDLEAHRAEMRTITKGCWVEFVVHAKRSSSSTGLEEPEHAVGKVRKAFVPDSDGCVFYLDDILAQSSALRKYLESLLNGDGCVALHLCTKPRGKCLFISSVDDWLLHTDRWRVRDIVTAKETWICDRLKPEEKAERLRLGVALPDAVSGGVRGDSDAITLGPRPPRHPPPPHKPAVSYPAEEADRDGTMGKIADLKARYMGYQKSEFTRGSGAHGDSDGRAPDRLYDPNAPGGVGVKPSNAEILMGRSKEANTPKRGQAAASKAKRRSRSSSRRRRRRSGSRSRSVDSLDEAEVEDVFRFPSRDHHGGLNRIQMLAKKHPGALGKYALRAMHQQLDPSRQVAGGAEYEEVSFPPVAVQYYHQVLVAARGAILSKRDARELFTLATALDLVSKGKICEALDLLAQRFKSVELAAETKNWEAATQLELLPAQQGATSQQEVNIAMKQAAQLARTHKALTGKGPG